MTKRSRSKNTQPGPWLMIIIGGGLIVLAVVAALSIPNAQASVQSGEVQTVPVAVNFPMIDVALNDLTGQHVAFSDYSGQVILYNAWATWCPPCKAEMPVLEQFYQDHKDKGFVVIAVEDGQPVDEVAAFVTDYGLSFPVWPDEKWAASESWGVQALPTSFVIDRNGVVRLTWTGEISREMLDTYVVPLIEEN